MQKKEREKEREEGERAEEEEREEKKEGGREVYAGISFGRRTSYAFGCSLEE
jgi:hypothetical protein